MALLCPYLDISVQMSLFGHQIWLNMGVKLTGRDLCSLIFCVSLMQLRESQTPGKLFTLSVKLFSEVRLAFINVVSPTAVRTQI